MTQQQELETALQVACDDPALLVITGSRLYGTARYDANGVCISDTDLRGVIVPPWEYLVHLPWMKSSKDQVKIPGEQDGIVYSINFFVRQLIACNPQHFELLFVPPQNVLRCTEVGRELFAIREKFVCQRFYKRIFGFGNSEWRKARGVEFEKTERTKTEAEIINDIGNVFGPSFGDDRKEVMDEIVDLLYSHHDKNEVDSRDKLTGKRKAEFEKYGYGASSACHSVRLVRQCAELLRTGFMTFPRPDAAQLSDIKHGRLKFSEVEAIYAEALADAELAVSETKLPEQPDIAGIKEWYTHFIANVLANDNRLTKAAVNG